VAVFLHNVFLNADIEAQPDYLLVLPGRPKALLSPGGRRAFGSLPGIKQMVAACRELQ
jgi:hypothetical protein